MGVDHSGRSCGLKATRAAVGVLLLIVGLQAFCAGLTQGKVVWWGEDFLRSQHLNAVQTNGVVQLDDEILTNIVAIFGGDEKGVALRSDGTVIVLGMGVLSGLSNAVMVAPEGGYCWGIRPDGTVAKWGNGPRYTPTGTPVDPAQEPFSPSQLIAQTDVFHRPQQSKLCLGAAVADHYQSVTLK